MKKIFLLASAITIAAVAYSQKKPLDHTVYDNWQSIGERAISNDGKFVVYTITPQEGDATLVVQQTDGKKIIEVPRGYQAKITDDNRFVVFKIKPTFQQTRDAKIKKKKADDMPKDSLGIVEVSSVKLEKYPRVKTFKIPDESSVWLAWHYEKPEPKKKSATDTTSKKEETPSPGDENEGTVLMLRNLVSGNTDSIKNVTEYFFNKTGVKLAYEISGNKKDSTKGLVVVMDLTKGEKKTIMQNFNEAKGYAWDEAGDQLAFVAERDSAKKESQKFYKLWYYKEGADSANSIADRSSAFMPSKWSVSENATLSFSKSGNRLLFGTAPIIPPKDTTLPEFERVSVDVWHYNEDVLQPVQLKTLDNELKRNYLAIYDVNSQKILQVGDKNKQNVLRTLEGDGKYFYSTSDSGRRVAGQWQGYTLNDVYAINTENGSELLVQKDFKGNVYPSYTGKYLLMYDDKKRKYSVFNSETKAITPVAADIKFPLYDEENDVPSDPDNYGIVKWMKDDMYVLIYDKYDVWRVDPNGKEKSIALTNGRKDKTTYRYVALDPEEKFITEGQEMLFRGFDEKNKASVLIHVYSRDNKYEQLPITFSDQKRMLIGQILKGKNGQQLVFSRETFTNSPDLYSFDTSVVFDHATMKDVIKLTNLNPQQSNYLWGTAELYKWKAYTGKLTEGVLYKPENFDPKKKYPMLVYFYERSNQNLNRYYAPSPSASTINIPFFVSRGYVVFVPDIWYKTGYPGKSAYDYIVSGTRALIKDGFIDSTKIGIQGQSWGGYQTAYVITKTNLYKAAWAGAPVANMFSAYGGIRWESGLNRQFQYEHTQSRIGATIWDRPDLYIENSPLFHLKKVKTPLVIMANDADGAVPWYQGIELFTAMRRLNKPVWMLNYNNEAHNLMERRNRKDIQVRLQQYFDWLLKDEPAPKWITEGVPAIMKGRDWGLGY